MWHYVDYINTYIIFTCKNNNNNFAVKKQT